MPVAEAGVEAAADILFELGIPFRSLALSTPTSRVHFFVELLRDEQSDRADSPRRRHRNHGSLAGLRIDHVASVRRVG